MRKFKKAPNCGPVPYPDRSGRMLRDEIVEGDEWADLVALGFVVEMIEYPPKAAEAEAPPAPKVEVPPASPPVVEAPKQIRQMPKKGKGNHPAKRDNISATDDSTPSGEAINAQAHVGEGASGVDSPETGGAKPEGSAE